MIFAYPPYNLFGFIWIGLIPLLIFIYSEKTNPRQAFWAGLLAGFIFLGNVIRWVFSAYPADWMNLGKGPVIFSLLILVWLVCSLALAVFVGLFSFALQKIKKENWLDFLLIPCLWVIFEYLRAWSLGILWLGRDSLSGPHWTFGFLGYGLADSKNLLQLAGIAGVYGLSFLIVLINALIFFTLKKLELKKIKSSFLKPDFWKSLMVLVLIFVFLNVVGVKIRIEKERNKPNQSLNVAFLQTKFPSHFEINREIIDFELDTDLKLLNQAVASSPPPNLVIFPEDSRFLKFLAKYRPDFNLKGIFKDNSISIIDSSRVEDSDGKIYFQLYYFNSQKGLTKAQKKSFLMPGGEYFPYLARAIVGLAGGSDWLDEFETNREYSKGTNFVLGEYEGVKIGTLFCPEIFSPGLYRKINNLGAEVLVNISGHGIFRGSPSLLAQARASAKLRAVENNRYLIQTINYNLSSAINNQGEIVASGSQIGNEAVRAEISPVAEKSFYSLAGDWILLLSAFIACLAFLNRERNS